MHLLHNSLVDTDMKRARFHLMRGINPLRGYKSDNWYVGHLPSLPKLVHQIFQKKTRVSVANTFNFQFHKLKISSLIVTCVKVNWGMVFWYSLKIENPNEIDGKQRFSRFILLLAHIVTVYKNLCACYCTFFQDCL